MFDSLDESYAVDRLRVMARRRLPRAVYDFYEGGAEDELTLRANTSAFQETRLLPRVLRNVAQVSCATALFGGDMRLPIGIAPMGAVGFGRRGADVDLARAAAHHGIPYVLSTSATASIEEIADRAPGRLWFQAYILQDKARLHDLIRRAEAAGYEGLVITVDLPVGGKRERDLRNGLGFPMRITPRNFLQFALRPRWSLDMLVNGPPALPNLKGLNRMVADRRSMQSTAGRNYDPAFDLQALAKLRDTWRGKLIVKGVVNPRDVDGILSLGADALVVSNHGGRQLDTCTATLDALPGIVQAVAGRVPVMLDGGIRRGSDIFKALALGAAGVLIGRAALFGALAGGYAGADKVLDIFHNELQRTMQLCGARSIAEIGDDMLASPPLCAAAPRTGSE